MKTQTGIWIDSSKAIIVSLDGAKERISEIDSDIEYEMNQNRDGYGDHRRYSEKKSEERKKNLIDFYIKDVLEYVKNTDELYVFGPAEAKTRLQKTNEEKKIVDPRKLMRVETSDKMTINEIVAKVKGFYKDSTHH